MFNIEENIDVDRRYAILPEYFDGMKAEERRSLMNITKQHNMCFSVKCVREIQSLLSIPMSDMQSLCVCVTLFGQHPDIIGMELPKLRDAEEADGVAAAAALPLLLTYNTWNTADYSGLTKNLLSFQLVPTNPDGTPAFLGVALLMHMPAYRNQHMELDESAGGPTDAIDVHIGER